MFETCKNSFLRSKGVWRLSLLLFFVMVSTSPACKEGDVAEKASASVSLNNKSASEPPPGSVDNNSLRQGNLQLGVVEVPQGKAPLHLSEEKAIELKMKDGPAPQALSQNKNSRQGTLQIGITDEAPVPPPVLQGKGTLRLSEEKAPEEKGETKKSKQKISISVSEMEIACSGSNSLEKDGEECEFEYTACPYSGKDLVKTCTENCPFELKVGGCQLENTDRCQTGNSSGGKVDLPSLEGYFCLSVRQQSEDAKANAGTYLVRRKD
ncbi:MAG: hypothetical protein KA436_02730 [Oligoflexales bacterium]|nr:hypothetical protein [Oligoflexales bacterium]